MRLFVNRLREMVSFELGKEIEKDVFCLVTSVGQRKKAEYPWGIEPQTFGFCAPMLYRWATERRSTESEGLRFDSSWGLRIFSLSHARDKTETTFLNLRMICTWATRINKIFCRIVTLQRSSRLKNFFFSNWFFLHIIKIVSFRKKSNVTKLPYQFLLFGTKTI